MTCPDKLNQTPCALNDKHKGPHQDASEYLKWPNKAEPLEGQGIFFHECPWGKVCPVCGSHP